MINYYYEEMKLISSKREQLKYDEHNILYVYNSSHERISPTFEQLKEIIRWFDRKVFQLFNDIIGSMDNHKLGSPYFFAAELRAFTRFLDNHHFLYNPNIGVLSRFINSLCVDFCEDFNNEEICELGTGCRYVQIAP